jgi:hypothetical protein
MPNAGELRMNSAFMASAVTPANAGSSLLCAVKSQVKIVS